MTFKVEFKSESGIVAGVGGKNLGLNELDRVREVLQTPQLPAERVRSWLPEELFANVFGSINESTARRSGLFMETSKAEVRVPRKSLDKYVFIRIKSERNDLGEVKSVEFRPEMDIDAIMADWCSAGFPTEWNPED